MSQMPTPGERYQQAEWENARLLDRVVSLEAALVTERCVRQSLESFFPTSGGINALPKGIREYVHQLETLSDPSGIVRENMLARDEIQGARLLLEEAKRASQDAETREAKLRDVLLRLARFLGFVGDKNVRKTLLCDNPEHEGDNYDIQVCNCLGSAIESALGMLRKE